MNPYFSNDTIHEVFQAGSVDQISLAGHRIHLSSGRDRHRVFLGAYDRNTDLEGRTAASRALWRSEAAVGLGTPSDRGLVGKSGSAIVADDGLIFRIQDGKIADGEMLPGTCYVLFLPWDHVVTFSRKRRGQKIKHVNLTWRSGVQADGTIRVGGMTAPRNAQFLAAVDRSLKLAHRDALQWTAPDPDGWEVAAVRGSPERTGVERDLTNSGAAPAPAPRLQLSRPDRPDRPAVAKRMRKYAVVAMVILVAALAASAFALFGSDPAGNDGGPAAASPAEVEPGSLPDRAESAYRALHIPNAVAYSDYRHVSCRTPEAIAETASNIEGLRGQTFIGVEVLKVEGAQATVRLLVERPGQTVPPTDIPWRFTEDGWTEDAPCE